MAGHLLSCLNWTNRQGFRASRLISLRTILLQGQRAHRTHLAPPTKSVLRCSSATSSGRVQPIFAPKTCVDHLPPPARPYLFLTRIDKPIGTLLLFYPGGPF